MDYQAVSVAAQKHLAALAEDSSLSSCLPQNMNISAPDPKDLRSFIDRLAEKSNNKFGDAQVHSEILALEAYLRNEDIIRDISNEDSLNRLQDILFRTTVPSTVFADRSPFSAESDIEPPNRRRLRALYEACLTLLIHLKRFTPLISGDPPADTIIALTSFTNPSDPWTTAVSYEHAKNLLEALLEPLQEDSEKKLQPLLTSILRDKIKPLFAKSKNPAITAAGRKAISPLPAPMEYSIDETEIKPWKYRDVYIVTVFEWTMTCLDISAIESNWPLLIPPLLALLDDSSTHWKVRGCSILSIFLHTLHEAKSNLLERTGLGEVFQSALMPCLLFLPSLTPEEESLNLLTAVYPTLLAVVRTRFDDAKDGSAKQKALDGIFRYGILKGYAHAGEHVKIAELLVREMGDFVQAMGIDSCRHLKDILPMLSSILSAPFATAYPPLLLAAVEAIERVILIDWPRISYHRGEILRGLVVCWCRIAEEEELSKELSSVRAKIKECTKLLTAVLDQEVDVGSEYRSLIGGDSRLKELLVTS